MRRERERGGKMDRRYKEEKDVTEKKREEESLK